jgi:hypothetical protein
MTVERAVPAASTIRLEGVFDGAVAWRLASMLVHADASRRLEVDLSKVREFHDVAIAVLGQALTRSPARVTLRGLRQRQVVVLRYFGVDARLLESARSDAA